jgi:hypothetical protein
MWGGGQCFTISCSDVVCLLEPVLLRLQQQCGSTSALKPVLSALLTGACSAKQQFVICENFMREIIYSHSFPVGITALS